ncbi:hypothetical protein ABB02_00717 [Clostridiaceae bacterium JG1575]|nr:hypothetical protein ABB02_00717 [Clostridiaceae bacterium JG1575]
MTVEKKRQFIIKFLYLLIIGAIVFVAAKYVVPLFAPFIVGLIIASLVRGIVKPIQKRTRWTKNQNRMLMVVVLALVYFVIVLLLVFTGSKLVEVVRNFFNHLPTMYTKDIQPAINKITVALTQRFPALQPAAEASYQSINQTLLGLAEKASNTVLSRITGVAGTLTGLILRLLFTIISSVFFTMDLDRIEDFLKRQMGDRTLHIYENVIYNIGHTAFRFIRAYFIIILVTFTELSVGFHLIKIPNAFILALAIALMDALPVVGTGTVMVPWILYQLVMGNFPLALSLFILYVIIFVVRQAIEPKVVGDQIGLHPIIILMCLFVGVQLFGIVGMFVLPLAITIFKKLNDDKIINVLK